MRGLTFVVVLAALMAGVSATAPAATPFAVSAIDPIVLVNPLIGTTGTDVGGPSDTFPGADVPFGMVQWSPDTPSQSGGGGYEYGDKDITGFSLTHLSGPGCSIFGDFAILPTIGKIVKPWSVKQPFTHASEHAAPGSYSVMVGDPGIRVALTVTPRTGLGSFTYPPGTQANLLFNVSSDQAGVTNASIRIAAPDEIAGSVSSGSFCGMPDTFTVHFVARFDRPFSSYGTWKSGQLSPGSGAADGVATGGWVTFDTSSDRVVKVKVALSFVDAAGALANLRTENRGWNLADVRSHAEGAWRDTLGRVAIEGGMLEGRRTFYTALYHVFLHPNVYSDVTGRYRGFDGAIHEVAPGHTEYANFSGWDIYRTQVPLIALLAPRETSDMMQSLVDDARQGGWLPKWPVLNGYTGVMGGDSADPIIAGAYAFGARAFDLHGALAAMVRGASEASDPPGQRWYVERPELSEYLTRGYVVNTHSTSVAPLPNGASETLEYALDDFSIAQLAREIGDSAAYRALMQRSANWTTLFDTATGSIAPRGADGEFMETATTADGQSGFQEGTAEQYTWMVPYDLHDLIAGMGGSAAVVARLDTFFSKLNAGEDQPSAWLGNEPSLGVPWIYLSAGAPWRTQSIVRQALMELYGDAPDGIPGNDDLGTMSAWYVWCAIGLYPQNPAVRVLDVGSPLFPHVVVTAPGGPTIEIRAPGASAAAPYVQALRVNGIAAEKTWIALPLRGKMLLDFDLAPAPNMQWGTAPDDVPPSYAAGPVHFPPSTAAKLTPTSMDVSVSPGASAALQFALTNQRGQLPVSVTWKITPPNGFTLQPDSGTLDVAAGTARSITVTLHADRAIPAGYYDIPVSAQAENGAVLEHIAAIVRVERRRYAIPLAYAENLRDNTVTPIDLATGGVGPPIPVGKEPIGAVLSPDGRRLYVTNHGSQSVSVVDTAKASVIATVKVGQTPRGIRITPDGTTLWLANSDDNTVQSIDTATLRVNDPIAVAAQPVGIAISPDGAMLYVTNTGANAVTPIDIRTRTAGKPIAVGAQPAGVAITPNGRWLYVVDWGSNDVVPIDLETGKTLPAIAVGIGPRIIAISPDGRLAYVTNFGTDTITPIDLVTNTARASIAVGGAPYGVGFTRDGKTAYVVNRADGDCVPVDVATGRVGMPIALGNIPLTIAMP